LHATGIYKEAGTEASTLLTILDHCERRSWLQPAATYMERLQLRNEPKELVGAATASLMIEYSEVQLFLDEFESLPNLMSQ
jgi:hypothetical protein